MRDLSDVLEGFEGLRVAVIGDAALDTYLEGDASRLCREGPVPVVRVTSRRDFPGAGANAAVNVSHLGGAVTLVSVIGDDEPGEILLRELHRAGVDTRSVVVSPDRATLWLERLSAGGQLITRVDRGTSEPLSGPLEERLSGEIERAVAGADAIILSDYEHGVLSSGVVARLVRAQAVQRRLLVVDSKHPAGFRSLRPTAVKPNWSEALTLLGSGELDGVTERAEGIAEHGERVLELTGADIAAVTLDREGAVVFERDRPPHRTYAQPADDSRAAGAGDTFLAALTLALAAGADTPTAAELAAAAANYVVEEDGTKPCSALELEAQLAGGRKIVRDDERLESIIGRLRDEGRIVVFTNGCFDLLHRGHITYLNRAKNLGDVLVVGVNSDESVRNLKGDGRPINPLDDRLQVISALSCVDYVVPFEGSTPESLLRTIRPDRYVKGGDYTSDTLPERELLDELGVQAEFLPLMQDRSTTGIIDRIRQREPA